MTSYLKPLTTGSRARPGLQGLPCVTVNPVTSLR
jgi:hypothetical protein